MLSVRDFLLVMFKSAFVVAFLSSIPRPVVAFTGFRNWSRKALYTKVDLCTQSCYSQIIPGLYLSNAAAANDRFVLRQLGITHILTVEVQRLPPSTFIGNNIKNLFIMALDTEDTYLLQYFPLSNAFIDQGMKNGNVLVHCRMGISRSATLVMAFLMEKYKLPFNEAYMLVKEQRPFVHPNPGFVNQLRMYERNNYYVSGFRRLAAYFKVNAGENKVKVVTYAALVIGIMVPVTVVVILG